MATFNEEEQAFFDVLSILTGMKEDRNNKFVEVNNAENLPKKIRLEETEILSHRVKRRCRNSGESI